MVGPSNVPVRPTFLRYKYSKVRLLLYHFWIFADRSASSERSPRRLDRLRPRATSLLKAGFPFDSYLSFLDPAYPRLDCLLYICTTISATTLRLVRPAPPTGAFPLLGNALEGEATGSGPALQIAQSRDLRD